jgi:hypothetical protein
VRAAEAVTRIYRIIPPQYAAGYLTACGWRTIDTDPERYALWGLRRERKSFEAFLPLKETFSDYDQRIAELLSVLEVVESRPQLAIVEDILAAPFDVLRFSAIHESHEDGSVALDTGVALVARSRDMVMAASCAAVERRPFFPTRKPTEAVELIKSARLGQTETGSFVVRVYVPIMQPDSDPDPAQARIKGVEPDSLGRKTTKTLLTAVARISAIASSGKSPRPVDFGMAMKSGVTANLCDALTELRASGARAVELGVQWSLLVPAPSTPKAVRIDETADDVLRDASRFYRAHSDSRPGTVITGSVTVLRREQDQPAGEVTISTYVDDKPRKVLVALSGEQYHEAIEAHDLKLPVVCHGDLVKVGRQFELSNPKEFSVLRQLKMP